MAKTDERDHVDRWLEEAWLEEIEARAEALDRGEATADDWQTSLERVRRQLREGRSASN